MDEFPQTAAAVDRKTAVWQTSQAVNASGEMASKTNTKEQDSCESSALCTISKETSRREWGMLLTLLPLLKKTVNDSFSSKKEAVNARAFVSSQVGMSMSVPKTDRETPKCSLCRLTACSCSKELDADGVSLVSILASLYSNTWNIFNSVSHQLPGGLHIFQIMDLITSWRLEQYFQAVGGISTSAWCGWEGSYFTSGGQEM